MAEKSVVITYETLFELLSRERERPELQKLETNFYIDVIDYLKEKSRYTEEIKNNQAITFEEKMKAERQLHNLHKIIKDLYERREKKILLIALDKSRTKSNIIDTSALLQDERKMLDSLTNSLDSFRADIIENVMAQRQPQAISNPAQQPPIHELQRIIVSQKGETGFSSALELEKPTKLVRFVHAVPKFVGTELEEYGPFQEEDVANLPSEIAELLVAKGRVEEIKGS